MSIYVPSNSIMSELRCHGNLLTSSKTAPLCLRQVLVVRMSIIPISDRWTSFFNNIQVFMGHFLIICHDLSRMANFVTVFAGDLDFFEF